MDTEPSSSTSTGRQLRQRKKRRYDLDDDSDDELDQTTRRVSRRQPRSPSVRKPRRVGKLASFVNLPLDILHEIFGHLHPYELLKLARTTKDFRRILMHKSSMSTWKESFSKVEGLPECPPEMSEPAWANLVFSPQCHVCLTPGVRNVEWRFRIRMCSKCAATQLLEIFPYPSIEDTYRSILGGFGLEDQNLPDIRYLLPNREGKRFKRVFMREDLISFRDKYKALPTPEERLAFIDERGKALEALNLHSTNCSAWSHNQADDRSDELNRLRHERRLAVIKKLEQLGYKKDLDSIRYPDNLGRQPFVNKPQRLTERIWTNIKPAAIKFMDQMRQKRLDREHEALVIARKADAGRFLKSCKNDMLPCDQLLPEPPDFCQFPQIAEILERPLEAIVDVSSFEAVTGVETLFTQWRKQTIIPYLEHFLAVEEIKGCARATSTCPKGSKQLLQQFPQDAHHYQVMQMVIDSKKEARHRISTLEEIDTKMKLAATVYTCRGCYLNKPSGFYYDDDDPFGFEDFFTGYDSDDSYLGMFQVSTQRVKPLFYPQVLGHPCLTRTEDPHFILGAFSKVDASTHLVSSPMKRKRWSVSKLQLDTKASEMAEQLVKLVGLDPETATSEDMDALQVRFRCDVCPPHLKAPTNPDPDAMPADDESDVANVGESIAYYSWRAAVRHQMEVHFPKTRRPDILLMYASTAPLPSPSAANLKIVPATDPLFARIEEEEARIEREHAEIWSCAHCRDTPQEERLTTLGKIELHVQQEHQRPELALNIDYFKHFSALDLKTSPECTVLIDQD